MLMIVIISVGFSWIQLSVFVFSEVRILIDVIFPRTIFSLMELLVVIFDYIKFLLENSESFNIFIVAVFFAELVLEVRNFMRF